MKAEGLKSSWAQRASRRVMVQVSLLLGLLGLAAFTVHAGEGDLAALYRRFLAGEPSTGFVAFGVV